MFGSLKCVFPKCTFLGPQLSCIFLICEKPAMRAPAHRMGLIIMVLLVTDTIRMVNTINTVKLFECSVTYLPLLVWCFVSAIVFS